MMTEELWAEYQRAGIIRADKTFEDFERKAAKILMMTRERWAEYRRAGIIRADKTAEFHKMARKLEKEFMTCEEGGFY
jgi:acyl-CoA synthetase (NDP forming)